MRSLVLAACVGPAALAFGTTPSKSCPSALEPAIPGVLPGKDKPSIILAQDIDWPPYAYLANPPEGDYTVAGFGFDVAMGLMEVCDIDMTVTQADWAGCWGGNKDAEKIGAAAQAGVYHGCMTYTHTIGSRPRWMEFSHSILEDNKAGGLLVLLDENGKPKVSPTDTLEGKKIVDVIGWAPTPDGLDLSKNVCLEGEPAFSGFEWVNPSNATTAKYDNRNDQALQTLVNGEADAMWVYADQAYTYDCSRPDVDGIQAAWDCDLWTGLGTKWAYIHTGLFDTAINGTTLTMSKKGSKLAHVLNPCIEKFIQTESYYKVCKYHGFTEECYQNKYFPSEESTRDVNYWELPTNKQTGGCSSGYCGCDGRRKLGSANGKP